MSLKQCPRCKQKDNTDFSSCRFCGVRYDAVPQKTDSGMGLKVGFWPFIIILFAIVWFNQTAIINGIGFVATGGKQKNVVDDTLINFAAATSGQDANGLKDDISSMNQALNSDGPFDPAFVTRMAQADHKSEAQVRAELEQWREEHKHRHHHF